MLTTVVLLILIPPALKGNTGLPPDLLRAVRRDGPRFFDRLQADARAGRSAITLGRPFGSELATMKAPDPNFWHDE
jgi:hypothetical protein